MAKPIAKFHKVLIAIILECLLFHIPRSPYYLVQTPKTQLLHVEVLLGMDAHADDRSRNLPNPRPLEHQFAAILV